MIVRTSARRPYTGPPLPPISVQVKGLASAAASTLVRAFKGQTVRRSPEDQAACLLICTGDETRPKCEEYNEQKKRCGKCGCFPAFASQVAAKPCPRKLWPAVLD